MEHMASFGILLRKEDKTSNSSFVSHQDQLEDVDLPPAHRAAALGDVGTLVKVIQMDPSLLELHSTEGLTPLAQAVLCQQPNTMKRLIKLGANIDAQDNVGRTILSIAAYQGWHQGVMYLLRNGAKQSICDKSGRYPLHAATYHSDMSTLSLLLNSLTVKEINQPDREQMTAVHWAAFHDRPDHLMELIRRGGDILAKDVDGKLPLHWAAQNNSFQCVHRLTSLTEGYGTINDLDFSGKSPMHYAAAAGATNIIRILSRCEGILLEIEDPDERTPLHWAAAMGHSKTVELLLKLGVKPYPMDVDGGTPLEYALQAGNKECVKVMEDFLGSQNVKSRIQSQQALRAGKSGREMDAQHRYHYTKPLSSPSFNDDGIPRIKIQAPTTTNPNQTTTKQTSDTAEIIAIHTSKYQGDGDGSTDTDRSEIDQDAVTTRGVYYVDQNTNANDEDKTPLDVLSQLVGSSFMIGAQAPILRDGGRDATPKDTPRSEASLKDQTCTYDTPDDKDHYQWAQPCDNVILSPRDQETAEMKISTSMNTPELQRVSVQSFRSIPPIVSRDGKNRDGSAELPLRAPHVTLQGAKFTPLPSIGKSTGEQRSPPLNDTTVEEGRKSRSKTPAKKTAAPLGPINEMIRIQDQDQTKPSPKTGVPIFHDFVTENISETRVLTKRLHGKVGNTHQTISSTVPSTHNSWHQQLVKHTPNRNKAKEMTTGNQGLSPAFLMKHSRIPSTSLNAKKSAKPRAPATGSKHKGVGLVPHNESKDLSMSRNREASIDIIPHFDRYLTDDDERIPYSPTPLAAETPRYKKALETALSPRKEPNSHTKTQSSRHNVALTKDISRNNKKKVIGNPMDNAHTGALALAPYFGTVSTTTGNRRKQQLKTHAV